MSIKDVFSKKDTIEDDFLDVDRKDVEDVLKEIESKTKIMEIDFERRLVYLEKEIEIIRSLIGKIKDEKSLKMLLKDAEEIKERLRTLEDLKYVEHLEVIDVEDKVALLKKEFDDIKDKYRLIVESLEKIPQLNDFALKFKDKYEDLERRINQIESLMVSIEDEYAKNEDVIALKDKNQKLEKDVELALRDVKNLSKTFKELSKINERMFNALNEKYEEVESKLEKYDSYEDEIEDIKNKMDGIAKRVIEGREEIINKTYAKIEYALKRYDKALNLLQYEINTLKHIKSDEITKNKYTEEVKKDINEIKKVKNEILTLIKEIRDISPQKMEMLSKLLSSKNKKIVEYEKEVEEIKERLSSLDIKLESLSKNVDLLKEKITHNNYVDYNYFQSKINEIKEETKFAISSLKKEKTSVEGIDEIIEYKKEIEKSLLNMSKNISKIINDKVKQMRKDLRKNIKEGIKYEIDSYLSDALIHTLKDELWEEMVSLVGTHEIKEEEKISIIEHFEKYLASRIDELKQEISTQIKEELLSLRDAEVPNEYIAFMRAELKDIKNKMAILIKEQQKKISELENKLRELEKNNKEDEGYPYIIE